MGSKNASSVQSSPLLRFIRTRNNFLTNKHFGFLDTGTKKINDPKSKSLFSQRSISRISLTAKRSSVTFGTSITLRVTTEAELGFKGRVASCQTFSSFDRRHVRAPGRLLDVPLELFYYCVSKLLVNIQDI